MGIYLNPGNDNFKETLNTDIYVDKTEMLDVLNKMLNTSDKYICMSRPRRFGKTITGNMIAAYYSKGCNSNDLFDELSIANKADYKKYLNQYNVIQIDVNSEYQNTIDKSRLITKLTGQIMNELQSEFRNVDFEESDSLANCIQKVYVKTGQTFIIILDEYDALVRERVSQTLFDEFLGLLNGLFKSNTLRPAISLAYLTGILPVVRDKVQSKLNNFEEYTILDAGRFAKYVGFTDDEVETLCNQYGMDYEECKRWYDGYCQNGYEIYNPESVIKSITRKKYAYYWSKTSTYEVIAERIRQNFRGTREDVIRMLAGESIDVNVTGYMNTVDSFATRSDVFTYLIHTGYLAYDNEEGTCRIPNREVRQEWFNAIEVNSDYAITNKLIEDSKELLRLTLAGDEDAVSKALDASHIHVASNRSYNNEDVLQSAIYLAYIYALNKYTVIKEMTTGKGFADVVYIPCFEDFPAMVIELKRNKSVDSAINQIKEKKYFDSLSKYKGNMLFVGINYDEVDKSHCCRIERFDI